MGIETLAIIAAYATIAAAALSIGLGIYSLAHKPPPQDLGKQDVKLTTSRYAEAISRVYGLVGVGSKIIWRGVIVEQIKQENTGGKRRDPSILRHQYYCSMGVLVCENLGVGSQLLGVTRIWLEGVQVYPAGGFGSAVPDGTNPPMIGFPGNGTPVIGGGAAFQIRIGLPNQDAWPLYESDQTTQHPYTEGTTPPPPQTRDDPIDPPEPEPEPPHYGLVSAHRQKLTVWWDYFALEKFYNRFPSQILIEVKTKDVSVADVFRRECLAVGIEDSELDLAALSDVMIDGIQIGDATSAKDVINQVSMAYACALIEVDGKLRGVKMPQTSPVAVILLEDLAAYQGAVEDTRSQDAPRGTAAMPSAIVRPSRVELTYYNRDKLYETSTQWAGRQVAVLEGGASDVTRVTLPMVLTPNDANEMCKRLLSVAWAESQSFQFTLPPKYIYLAPGDCISLPLPGRTSTARVTRVNFGANDVIEVQAVRQVAEAWDQKGIGSTGLFHRANIGDEQLAAALPTIDVTLKTRLFLGTVPPFVDVEDDTDAITFAACRDDVPVPPLENASYSWSGYQLYRNLAGLAGEGAAGDAEYVVVADLSAEATMGESTTSLPGWAGAFEAIDTVNYFIVKLYGVGVLEAIPPELFESVRTRGLCLLGREILQFRDVEPAGTNLWKISYLRRGLRGTHLITATHNVADRFLLYSPATVSRLPINQDENGKAFAFRAVSHELAFDTAAVVPFTPVAD